MNNCGTLAAIICILLSVPVPVAVAADLVDDTCNQTTHLDICLKTLRSYPQSSSADLRGLAVIMANATIDIGNQTLGHIQSLLQEPAMNLNSTMRELLESCEKLYTQTVSQTLQRARAEINYGAYELVDEDIQYARDTPCACEYGFIHETIESPLKQDDAFMGDLTDLFLEIVNLLF